MLHGRLAFNALSTETSSVQGLQPGGLAALQISSSLTISTHDAGKSKDMKYPCDKQVFQVRTLTG